MRVKRLLNAVVFLAAGFWCGLLTAQAFVVLALRNGGAPGGETIILIALPLALYAGYILGADGSRDKWLKLGYQIAKEDEKQLNSKSNTML